MAKVEPLVVNEFRALVEGFVQIEARSNSLILTDEERTLCELKVVTIEAIFTVLNLLEQRSEKQKILLNLCLKGGRCSSKDATDKYKSVDSMRSARNQFRFLLASTLFRSDKVATLIQSNSLHEVEEVLDWYMVNVLENTELKRHLH
jgi:hypothetical protein